MVKASARHGCRFSGIAGSQRNGHLGPRSWPGDTVMVVDDRIIIDHSIMGGAPCVRGTRIPVATILGWLGAGMSIQELLTDHYPQLVNDDIEACLRYAADPVRAAVPVNAADPVNECVLPLRQPPDAGAERDE